jgi:hypothetical protein
LNFDRTPIDFIVEADVKKDCYEARPVMLYLAGPMSGYVDYNFPLFHRVANLLRSQGYKVNNPADKETLDGTDLPDPEKVPTRAEAMKMDIPLVVECDGIVLLPCWKDSVGARFEAIMATQCGMDIYEWVEGPESVNGFWWLRPLSVDYLEGSVNKTTREELLSAIHSTEVSEEVRESDIIFGESDPISGRIELRDYYGVSQISSKEPTVVCEPELSDRGLGVCEGGAVQESCESLRTQQDGGERGPVTLTDDEIQEAVDGAYRDVFPDMEPREVQKALVTALSEGTKFDSDKSKLRYDLIPVMPTMEEAYVYTMGALKYADRNWENGIRWGRIFRAMMQHALAWWVGEKRDPDGQHPLASVVWAAKTLMEYEHTHPELDDRSKDANVDRLVEFLQGIHER